MAVVYVSNLVINAGCDFSQTLNLEEIETNSIFDLTGYSVFAQMRKWSGSSTAINFTVNTASASDGRIIITLTAQQTTNIKPGRYIYDVVTSDQYLGRNRVIEGMVLVREGVTR